MLFRSLASEIAEELQTCKQYDKALADADECIRLQPTWAKGYSRRGAALFRMDKLGPARDAFEKGLELDKDNATYVRCTRQELQLVMDAIAQRKEESLEFKERAIEAFNVQNFKRAEQHLSSAIELDPENHVFYSNRAAAYMALEQYDRDPKATGQLCVVVCPQLEPLGQWTLDGPRWSKVLVLHATDLIETAPELFDAQIGRAHV